MSNRKLATILVAAGVLAIAGCATTEGYNQRMTTHIGMSADQLLMEWGVPDNLSKTGDGNERWTYYRVTEGHSGGSIGYDSSTYEIGTYTDEDGKERKLYATEKEPYYVPLSVSQSHCETRFVLGPDHIVRDVTFDGSGCVALEKKAF